MTVDVPLPVLDHVRASGFDWQVPGRREELVSTLVRALPKALRRPLVPVADHVRTFLDRATPADGPLLDVLARHLSRAAGTAVTPDDFQLDRVPPDLLVTFVVEDLDGRWLALGKDLEALQRDLHGEVRAAIARASGVAEEDGLRDWPTVPLPREVEASRRGQRVRAYPALVDQGDAVGVRVLASEAEQAMAMRAGTRRLLLLTLASPRRVLERSLPDDVKLALARSSTLGTVNGLLDDCTACAVDALVDGHGGPAWDEQGFARLRDHVRAGLAARRARSWRPSATWSAPWPPWRLAWRSCGRPAWRCRSPTCGHSSPVSSTRAS